MTLEAGAVTHENRALNGGWRNNHRLHRRT
jgi:hypothetical protein